MVVDEHVFLMYIDIDEIESDSAFVSIELRCS